LWSVDPKQSTIEFKIRLLGGSTRGRFTGFEATIATAEDPLASSVSTTINLASIDTGSKKRDKDLRSAAYLDVETRSNVTYRSTRVHVSEGKFRIEGDLTLFGITHSVPLTVEEYNFAALSGGQRATFTATAHIDRRDFGFKIAKDGGGWVVSNKVWITLRIAANLTA
jgi:polyisoprenoid-binding protein YceI